ncbi:MAG: hypothetical protein OJF50_000785 [Nitrospira sp.]|nr:hypothetical protein [Nitrospira sp.]
MMTLSQGSACLFIGNEKPYVEESRVSTNGLRAEAQITWTARGSLDPIRF